MTMTSQGIADKNLTEFGQLALFVDKDAIRMSREASATQKSMEHVCGTQAI